MMIFSLDKKSKEEINKLIDTYLYNNEVANYLNAEIINEQAYEEEISDYKIKELKIDDYLNNPYYQKVIPNEIKEGRYQIKYEKYRAYQRFLYDEIKVNQDDYFVIHNPLGYFAKDFKYLTIQKDNVLWMSVIPHEINTMKKCENNLSQHVYVLGLGLAYYPFMISGKVDKITIIEKDPIIIKLFKKYIFPYFPHQEKYEIIQADAFSYVGGIKPTDSIFVDLWHNANDGLNDYLRLRKILKDHQKVNYWIEESLIMAYRNIVINLIDEELNHPGEINYQHADNQIDAITNHLHQILETLEIKNYQDIKSLLSNDNLKELMLK